MTELPTEQTTSQTYRNAFLVAAVLWGISFQFMPLFELSGVLVKVQHLLLLFLRYMPRQRRRCQGGSHCDSPTF